MKAPSGPSPHYPWPAPAPLLPWWRVPVKLVKGDVPTSQVRMISEAEASFFHSGWSRRRAKVAAALSSGGVQSGRFQRFINCGSGAWAFTNVETGDSMIAANFCRDRFCSKCNGARARVVAANLNAAMEGRTCLTMELTVQHSPGDTLLQLVDTLYESFARLRNQQFWKDAVAGGAFVLELKHTLQGGWHPHLHLVVESDWVSVELLREGWRKATGGSFVVWVQRVGIQLAAARYVAKYLTKVVDSSVYASNELLCEAIEAMKGRRQVATFGAWRGIKLTTVDEEFVAEEWVPVAPLGRILAAQEAGEEWACKIFGVAPSEAPAGVNVRLQK